MNMKRSFGEEGSTVADVLMFLSRGGGRGGGGGGDEYKRMISAAPNRLFECKTCNKRFPSFQALGGHRASHKKPKLSFDEEGDRGAAAAPKPKVHECSVCGLEFAIGQALGGHMRRHRTAGADQGLIGGHGFVEKKSTSNGKRVTLDLNLPPLEEAMEDHSKLELGLGPNFSRLY